MTRETGGDRAPRTPGRRRRRPFAARGLSALSATQVFVLSFLLLIVIGTAGFLFLPGLYTGPSLGFVDSLFTATSAVCVTGLIVVDTATYFTPLGQAWVALLIQVGGLGMLTFTTLIIGLVGGRVSLGVEEAAGGLAAAVRHLRARGLVKAVVLATFLFEAAGALSLWLAWQADMGRAGAVWPSVFHAVSAFCNAGFSIFSDSLAGYQQAPLTLGVVSALIVLGGIGFVVLEDVSARYLRPQTRRLGTHTRLVLGSTAVLLGGGTVLFLLFEAGNELRHLPRGDRLMNAWFMSVTPRTAGFNTVDYDAVTNPSLFLTILFMVIGGAPGSTAGGLKVTTVVLLGLLLWARLGGRSHVSYLGRTVPDETVQRAASLTVGGLAILAAAVFLLQMTELGVAAGAERVGFVRSVFEAHSAFGTVGLSMGITPDLSAAGRVVIVILMYVGRVGPLAVAAAMAAGAARAAVRYRYAHEDVIVG